MTRTTYDFIFRLLSNFAGAILSTKRQKEIKQADI